MFAYRRLRSAVASLRRRPAAWVALACYVAAVASSSGMHVHHHAGGCTAGHCHAAAVETQPCRHSCGHSHEHQPPHGHTHSEPASGETPGTPPLHDDDCSACQFLAQKPLPVEPVTVVPLSDLLPEPPLARPISVDHPAVARPTSRGPPCV